MVQDMRRFFYPKSLAVVGVSDSPSNLARVIMENLQRFGYEGRAYPVGIPVHRPGVGKYCEVSMI
jgi:acyl-CoA synthetase (NDP forming)